MHHRLAEQARRYPNLSLRPLDTSALSGPNAQRDAALAHAIEDAVLRRWIALEAVLSGFLDRPAGMLDPIVRAVLLAGAAQLLLLERLPPHAVINEAVGWTRRAGRARATGLVNAVLRRLAEASRTGDPGERRLVGEDRPTAHVGHPDRLPLSDGRALRLDRPVFPEDPAGWLSAAVGLPGWLVQRWLAEMGESATIEQALHTLVHPPVVINHRHAVEPLRPPEGLRLVPHALAWGLSVLEPAGASPQPIVAERTDAWVQDATSADALELLGMVPGPGRPAQGAAPTPTSTGAGRPPRLIVDLCAGLGTKTRQLRAMFPSAEVLACDTHRTRARGLARVFAGDQRVRVLGVERVLQEAAGRADLVLLDVPCSNSGVLARRPEARHRLDRTAGPAQLKRLTAVQRDLLAQSRALLAPGGRLLYATCSLEPEENQAMVRWAQDSAGYALLGERLTLARGLPGEPATGYADGGYAAVLVQVGTDRRSSTG